MRGSPAGYLYGKFINHKAALAPTIRPAAIAPFNPTSATLRVVAEYTRSQGAPYRVMHDTTVYPPYGRFAVYIGRKRIGAGLSFPNADDCRHMEFPPAPQPITIKISKSTRRALGAPTKAEKEERAVYRKQWDARRKASFSHD